MIYLLLLASVPQLASVFDVSGRNRWFVYNFYIVADAFIWALIFFINIHQKIKFWITAFLSLFLISFVYLAISEHPGSRFFSELVCLNSMIQVVWVLIFFYETYKSELVYRIEMKPMFWFCMGILVYAPSTYFHFAFRDIINKSEFYIGFRNVHDVLNTLLFLFLAVGLAIRGRWFLKIFSFGN